MFFEKMNESYRRKHYPKGSVLEKLSAENKRASVVIIGMLALVATALGVAIVWEISLIRFQFQLGNKQGIQVGLVILCVTAAAFLLCIPGIVFLAKGCYTNTNTLIRASAEISGLSEEDIREFDRQAMQDDSEILKFKSGLTSALSGQKDGILTRDYLWLGDARGLIVKREDIVGVCLYKWSYYAGKKKMWSQSVAVLNRQNKTPCAEATKECGLAIMKLLSQEQPSVLVETKILAEGEEYDSWCKELCNRV